MNKRSKPRVFTHSRSYRLSVLKESLRIFRQDWECEAAAAIRHLNSASNGQFAPPGTREREIECAMLSAGKAYTLKRMVDALVVAGVEDA
jgi:hypothetical protein